MKATTLLDRKSVPLDESITTNPEDSRRRAEHILSKKIEFHQSECFPTTSDDVNRYSLPANDGQDEKRILTADEELSMFRAMNEAKFRADRLRKSLSPLEPSDELMDEIEALLAQADRLRNRIVCIFMKLGASIARNLANAEFPADDLKSEAYITLMRAVECFDCERGFRFSTYATHAVRRNLMRMITKCRKDKATFASTESFDELCEFRKWTWGYERQIAAATETLVGMIDRLEDRDRYIIRSRFGLLEGDGVSLQRIADELGVSRERVRQLERRAAERLRQMAKQENFEPLDA